MLDRDQAIEVVCRLDDSRRSDESVGVVREVTKGVAISQCL